MSEPQHASGDDRSGAHWPHRQLRQIVVERTDEAWRATEHGTEIEGTGHSAARAAEDFCRRVAERDEAPEPAAPTEGSA
jgi:hypothetical protein